ncbi:MAG: cytochrome c biogenesis protein ResB [Coriobacteriia bacterium]
MSRAAVPRRMRLVSIATSARTAAVLMALLGGLIVLGVVVPQRGVFGDAAIEAWVAASPGVAGTVDALGLHDVFAGWVFLLVVGLLGVNITACTVQRLVRRSRRSPILPESPPPSATYHTIAAGSDVMAAIRAAAAVTPGVWRIFQAKENRGATLRRGYWGFRGSVVAHAALVLLAVGALVSALTRFNGSMVLTTGQMLPDAPASYVSIDRTPWFGRAFEEFAVRLDSLDFTYDGSTVTEARAVMTVEDATGVRQEVAYVNRPLRAGGKSFLLEDAGHSVALQVTDPAGEIVLDSYINLGRQVPAGFSDTVDVGAGTLEITVIPHAAAALEAEAVRVLDLRDPAVVLRSAAGEELVLAPASSGTLGDLTVRVTDIALWNRFQVRADRGLPIVYLAFALALVGMAVRLADPDMTIGVLVSEDGNSNVVALWSTSKLAGAQYDAYTRRLLDRIETLEGVST